jgi:hypothetical protein
LKLTIASARLLAELSGISTPAPAKNTSTTLSTLAQKFLDFKKSFFIECNVEKLSLGEFRVRDLQLEAIAH